MSDYSYDGAPTQAGLHVQATHLTGRLPHFSATGLRVMVVTDVHYVDQPGNRSRRYTEYTCRDIQTGEFVPGCRTLSALGGVDDGDDATIAPATSVRPGARLQRFTKYTTARDTDGTVVLVGFIEGSHARGVILGSVPHSASTLGATSADGERRLVRHKNTSVEFKKDGTYVITRQVTAAASTTVTLQPSGDLHVAHHDGAHVAIERGVVTVDAAQIKLGEHAAEAVVMGNTADVVTAQPVAAAAATLSAAVTAARVALTPDVISGVPSGSTITALSGLLAALAAYASAEQSAFQAFHGSLSLKVKTE